MTQQQWTATQELQGALVLLDEAATLTSCGNFEKAWDDINKAHEAIERALKLVQHVRCDAVATLDKL